jgi:hypothetical protein
VRFAVKFPPPDNPFAVLIVKLGDTFPLNVFQFPAVKYPEFVELAAFIEITGVVPPLLCTGEVAPTDATPVAEFIYAAKSENHLRQAEALIKLDKLPNNPSLSGGGFINSSPSLIQYTRP